MAAGNVFLLKITMYESIYCNIIEVLMSNTTEYENTYGIKPWLWTFALDTISIYNIDASHGITHLVNTVLYVRIILDDFRGQQIIQNYTKAEETELIEDAAFVHDLIDKKYMDEQIGIARLRDAFVQNGYPAPKIEAIVSIIIAISFSTRVLRKKAGLPMIGPGPLALAIAIVIDADQLDGYDVRRCYTYQTVRFFGLASPKLKLDERLSMARNWTKTIMVNRILKYKTEYMNTEIAKKLAAPLHLRAEEYVKSELQGCQVYEYP